MAILRFVHIFSAIFWVGTTLFLVLFLEPTVRCLGPDGGKFMQRLLGGTRFSLVIALSAWITIIAGAFLYWPLTGWSPQVMFGSRLPLTLGALAGIAAGVVGAAVTGRASGQFRPWANRWRRRAVLLRRRNWLRCSACRPKSARAV